MGSGMLHADLVWRVRKTCSTSSAVGVSGLQSVWQEALRMTVEHSRARHTSASGLSGMPDLGKRSGAVAGKASHGGHVDVKDMKIELQR